MFLSPVHLGEYPKLKTLLLRQRINRWLIHNQLRYDHVVTCDLEDNCACLWFCLQPVQPFFSLFSFLKFILLILDELWDFWQSLIHIISKSSLYEHLFAASCILGIILKRKKVRKKHNGCELFRFLDLYDFPLSFKTQTHNAPFRTSPICDAPLFSKIKISLFSSAHTQTRSILMFSFSNRVSALGSKMLSLNSFSAIQCFAWSVFLSLCTANSKKDSENTPIKGGNVADLGLYL